MPSDLKIAEAAAARGDYARASSAFERASTRKPSSVSLQLKALLATAYATLAALPLELPPVGGGLTLSREAVPGVAAPPPPLQARRVHPPFANRQFRHPPFAICQSGTRRPMDADDSPNASLVESTTARGGLVSRVRRWHAVDCIFPS